NGSDLGRNLRLNDGAQGGAIGVIRTGFELLVPRPDLAPRADNTAGKGKNDVGQPAYRRCGAFRRSQGCCLIDSADEEIPARDPFDSPEPVFADKFTVHYGNAPVAPAGQLLRRLVGVTEKTQLATDRNLLVFWGVGDAVVAGRRGAGQHALADAPGE